MLIESRITRLLESVRRLQRLVQENSHASSKDVLRSQQLLKDCENTISDLFKLPGRIPVGVNDANTDMELNAKISSVALESDRVFNILRSLPNTKKIKINFFKDRDDNRLARNIFTDKLCHIRSEFGNDKELLYVVQYEDSSYGIVLEHNVQLV